MTKIIALFFIFLLAQAKAHAEALECTYGDTTLISDYKSPEEEKVDLSYLLKVSNNNIELIGSEVVLKPVKENGSYKVDWYNIEHEGLEFTNSFINQKELSISLGFVGKPTDTEIRALWDHNLQRYIGVTKTLFGAVIDTSCRIF